MSYTQYIVIIALLILTSAYFSATETAFSSLNKTRLKTLMEKENKKAALAYSLAEEYDKLISTILIGNNIVNIAVASLGTVLFTKIYGDLGATISTIVITVAILIFGEITPKSIAKDCPEKFAIFSSPIIKVFIWIFTPLNFLFTQWKKIISKLLDIEENSKLSPEELLMLVDEVEQEGSFDTDEGDIIRNAIEFKEQKAEDILTHRVDVEGVPLTATKEEIAKAFATTQYSRLIVYNENIDDIIGVIHLKDFFTASGITKLSIKNIMTKPLFIQKSEKIDDLLKILQKNKAHLAVVIDEYGGTLGIITMEDILEELVGEIWDEHDEVIEDFRKVNDNTYLIDGSANFEDFSEMFDFEAETDSVSVGGWIMEELGKIPEKGESFDFENLNITVTETDSHRITQLKVRVSEKNKDEDED